MLPLIERKRRLRDAFDDTPTLVYVTDVEGVGEVVFEQVLVHEFEGMVANRKGRRARPLVELDQDQEQVI